MKNPLKSFTIETVLRNTSPNVLQTYIDDNGLTGILGLQPLEDIQKASKKQGDYIEALLTAFHAVNPTDFAKLIKGMLRVHMLTRKNALLKFLQRCNVQEGEKTAFLQPRDKPYDNAFPLLKQFPNKIEDYYLVFMLESQDKRYWNKRRDYIPTKATAVTNEELEALKAEVKNHLKKEWRGNECDHRCINFNNKSYVFLMADDQPIIERAWQGKKIGDLSYIPVFQIAIVYDPSKGEVDICCENATTRLNVHRALAKTKFQLEDIPDFAEDDTVYDLDYTLELLLKRHRMDLEIPDGLPIEDIFIKAVRFRLDKPWGEITLDSKAKTRVKDTTKVDTIYALIRNLFSLDKTSRNTVPIEEAKPLWIEWVAAYRDPFDPKKTVYETFTMSSRNNCNLDLDGEHEQIRTCLEHNRVIRHKMTQMAEPALAVALP